MQIKEISNYSIENNVEKYDGEWKKGVIWEGSAFNSVRNLLGKKVKGYVGAEVDNRYSPPILLEGVIKSIKKGDINAETEVVIQTGSISVIVTKKRKPYHYEKDFSDLGLDLINTDIVVVKIGYLVPELYDIRGDWVMALTPGGVDQDLFRFDNKEIVRPIFPLDTNIENPDLSAKLIPKSN